ncbi:MAG TPA: DNA translocase FtsK 4TM domain-containing protein [Limnochordales bacterium]
MGRGRKIAATFLMALGLFSLLSLHTGATGEAGRYLSAWLRTASGQAATGIGLIVIWLGWALFRRPWDLEVARRLGGCLLILSVAAAALHVVQLGPGAWPAVWSVQEQVRTPIAMQAGGVLGGALAAVLMRTLGPLGTALAVLAMTVVAWLLLFDTFAGDWLSWAAYGVSGLGERIRAARRARSERRRVRAVRIAEEPAAARESAVPKAEAPRPMTLVTVEEEPEGARAKPRRRSQEQPAPPPGAAGDYQIPPISLLSRPRPPKRPRTGEEEDQAQLLEETLASFGIQARVVSISRGPVITRYEVQPPPGIKVSRIVGLADDISLALAAAGVRVEAPVPGKSVVGIEVPNRETSPVFLREILETDEFQTAPSRLTIGLGKDIAGKPLIADLTKLLHLLIAGATGSGKSVCLNSIIASLLFKARPDEVKMMMIDPKRVELSVYDGIPHLIAPVVTDPRQAAGALRWAVKEMERRYQLLSQTGARNIDAYNKSTRKPEGADPFLPYLVVIIDELADLMLVAAADVEDSICRLAQMARAAGIYLIIATQRPSVDVITGLIKANVPSRIAFAVSSQVDSRTILDMAGAERLLGKGDMLFYPIGAPKPIRAQGAWISDQEVEALADAWRNQGEPQYIEEVLTTPAQGAGLDEEMEDELYEDAVRLVREAGQASVSMLQRRFRIGYSRAARLIDMMEMRGVVGPYQGSKPREVIGADGGLRQR